DQRQLEEHLETCAACRTELAELREAAGLLAHASTPAEPGAAVRTRILDQVRNEKQPGVSSPVVPFKAQPVANIWPNLLRLAAAIAFVALLIGMAVLWRRDVRSRQEIARLSQQFNQQNEELARNREALARQREAIALMNAPGMKKMELAGTPTAQSARATFVYDQNTGRAMIMTNGLPAAPEGMAYEVWFIPKGHSPMPGKTFTVDHAGQGMMMDQMPAEAMDGATIAITLEPKGGSASPTGAIYLSSAS
ncbi:MAG TPA: anti-sigma factor, partial [Pyrinomonadaceae bacterium]